MGMSSRSSAERDTTENNTESNTETRFDEEDLFTPLVKKTTRRLKDLRQKAKLTESEFNNVRRAFDLKFARKIKNIVIDIEDFEHRVFEHQKRYYVEVDAFGTKKLLTASESTYIYLLFVCLDERNIKQQDLESQTLVLYTRYNENNKLDFYHQNI